MRKIRVIIGGWQTLVLALLLMCGRSEAGIIFHFTDGTAGGMNAAALAAFNRAGSYYSSALSNSMDVNLEISLTAQSGVVTGGAAPDMLSSSYSGFRSAIVGRSTSADDASFVGSLPSGSSFNPYINYTLNNPAGVGSATAYVDNTIDANNQTIEMTRANAKALGLIAATDSARDGRVELDSTVNWDYDPTDGIDSGKFDFTAAAAREIGVVMGFFSGVEVLDLNSLPPYYNDFSLDNVAPLDFTRFTAASEAAGADIDWTAGTGARYFSVDGGATVLIADAWSTGTAQGDGFLPHYWRNGAGLGLMSPNLLAGQAGGGLSANDLRAFDVLGYSLTLSAVPEPGSFVALAMIGSVAVGYRLRRRAAKCEQHSA